MRADGILITRALCATAGAGWLLASALVVGCGGGSDGASRPTDTARDAGSRELPPRVAPGSFKPDGSVDLGLRDDFFASYDAGPCCDVDFAVRAQPGEVYAILRGTDAPLDGPGGAPMTHKDGVWSTTVCMPPDYDGVYYYDVYLAPETDDDDAGVEEPAEYVAPVEGFEPSGLFTLRRHNPAVLSLQDPTLGMVNDFRATDACDGTGDGVHSTVDLDAGL